MIARNIPAGKFRLNYGFQRWNDFNSGLFENVRSGLDLLEKESEVEIFASDISGKRVDLARKNASNAGLQGYIRFDVSDFRDLEPPFENGFIFLNPPYGERLQGDEITLLYSMLGTTFKHRFPGFTVWIITPGNEGIKNMGLKPSAKYTLFNGAIECRFLRYDLYPGSRRSGIQNPVK
jgi:putative N6-adenine-specific DNA methylase